MPDRYRVSDLHELRDAIESAVKPTPAPARLLRWRSRAGAPAWPSPLLRVSC